MVSAVTRSMLGILLRIVCDLGFPEHDMLVLVVAGFRVLSVNYSLLK